MKRNGDVTEGDDVFVEERSDGRLVVGSGGRRDLKLSHTRGMAFRRGTETWSISDPHSIPDGMATQPASGESAPSHGSRLRSLAGRIVDDAHSVLAGRPDLEWRGTVVTFRQTIRVRSRGIIADDLRMGCRLEIQAKRGGRTAVEDLVSPLEDDREIVAAFTRAFDRAEMVGNAVASPPIGSCTAVFAPATAGIVVHELVGHALEGDAVIGGESWIFAGTLPHPERAFTVIDDPRRGRGAWAIDDEGSPAHETLLIHSGRRAGTLRDWTAAAILGGGSTGHGRRASYLDHVRPRMGCTFIDEGSDDPEEILRSTRGGLFIRRLASGHTHARAGVATFMVTDADRIVDGRIAEPLAPFVIRIDGPALWTSLDRIGQDLAFDRCVGSCVREGEPLVVSVGAPTIRIGVINVVC